MESIVKKIDNIARKYSHPFYVRADEKDLTLWGLKVGSASSTISLYKKQNKLLVNIDQKTTWFTINAFANYHSILEEVVYSYERLLKNATQDTK